MYLDFMIPHLFREVNMFADKFVSIGLSFMSIIWSNYFLENFMSHAREKMDTIESSLTYLS